MKTILKSLAVTGLVALTLIAPASAEGETMKQTTNAAEHLAVVDALHRFAWGMDTDDAAMIASAFSENGVADFSSAAKRIGVTFPALTGRETIQKGLAGFASGFITSHKVVNARVEVNGNEAKLRAIVEAQHIPVKDGSRSMLLENDYSITLIKQGDDWQMTNMKVENPWSQGDMKIFTGE
jgi:hypothetical protein